MSDKPILLITRPVSQASRSAMFYYAEGYDARIVPVLSIEYVVEAKEIETQWRKHRYDGLIITSQHALFGLEHLKELHPVPVYVPGGATATLAKSAGFQRVITGGGTARDLVAEIKEHARMLYLSGHDIAFNMVEALQKKNIIVDEMKVYRAEPNDRGVEALQSLTHVQQVDIVLFYSTRSARLFEAMIRQAKVSDYFKQCTAVVISEPVRDAMRETWAAIVVAPKPDEEGMLQAVKAQRRA